MTAMLTEPMTVNEARRRALDLIHEHGLVGWKVVFDNAKRRAGQCHYGKMEISLSRYVMAGRSFEQTMNTITHEVAHALTRGHNHDHVWAAKHRELGGDGERCYTRESVDERAPWIGTCGHGKQFAKYRRPKRLEGWLCNACVPGERTVITWVSNR